MDEFKPSYVLYAHKSERYPNRAACVYLEKGDEDEDLLSFALLEKDDMGNVRIVDKASYSIDVEIYPKNFVSGDIKAVTARRPILNWRSNSHEDARRTAFAAQADGIGSVSQDARQPEEVTSAQATFLGVHAALQHPLQALWQ